MVDSQANARILSLPEEPGRDSRRILMMRTVIVATVVGIGLSLGAAPASAAEEIPTYNQHVG